MPGFISSPPRATETPPKVTEAVQKELPYAIVNYPGKGRGLQASTPITKGSRILSEAPLLVIDEEPSLNYNKAEAAIARQLEDMSLEAQSEVLQLHNAHIDDLPELAGIFQTNGFTLDDGKVALFRHTCLINHSCQPNVEAEWNGNSGQMVVHAIRDLAPGEELTHDYLHTLDVFNERQKELEVIYGFTCDCVVCSLPEAERRISDTRRKEFKMCEDMIAKMIFDAPIPSLHVARHMLDVIKKDNIMGAHKPKVWFYACQVAIAHADLARASVFANRAYEGLCTFKGKDHAIKVRKVMKSPSKNDLYGDSFLWQTSINDKPQGLKEEDFEEWLWHPAVLQRRLRRSRPSRS